MNNLVKLSLQKLKLHNIPNPDLDLRVLLNFSSKSKKEIFLSNFNYTDIDSYKFHSVLNRRLNFEPISKIINKKNFWKYDFYVDDHVLDPRPETELIIEESLKLLTKKNKKINILDLGTGSGCLAVCLAKEFINSKITAIDISTKAMKVASTNFNIHKCKNRITKRICGVELVSEKFDLIVSNPPYLSKEDYENTNEEIKKYEPKKAFCGGNDGLFFYKKFAKTLPKLMKSDSYLILEIGEKQASNCIRLFGNSGLNFVKKAKDLQKKDRILIFSKL